MYVSERLLGHSSAPLQGYQLYDSNTTELGLIDRLSILLNSECKNYFLRRDRVFENVVESNFSIQYDEHNSQRLSHNLTYFNDSNTNTETFATTRDATTTSVNTTYLNNSDATTNMAVEDILFHLANILFLISYLAPPTRYGQVCLHSGLCVGFLVFATWAWNIVCRPDVFVWYFAFVVFNAGQLLYILYQV